MTYVRTRAPQLACDSSNNAHKKIIVSSTPFAAKTKKTQKVQSATRVDGFAAFNNLHPLLAFSKSATAGARKEAIAVFPYTAQQRDELTLRVGDLITGVVQVSSPDEAMYLNVITPHPQIQGFDRLRYHHVLKVSTVGNGMLETK